jgi:hypothetical protein
MKRVSSSNWDKYRVEEGSELLPSDGIALLIVRISWRDFIFGWLAGRGWVMEKHRKGFSLSQKKKRSTDRRFGRTG